MSSQRHAAVASAATAVAPPSNAAAAAAGNARLASGQALAPPSAAAAASGASAFVPLPSNHAPASPPVAASAGDDDMESESSFSGSESNEDEDVDEAGGAVQHLSQPAEAAFDTFDQLKKSCEAKCGCKLSNNCRTVLRSKAPKWMQTAFPDVASFRSSGTLYCYQPFNDLTKNKWARTSCSLHVRYDFGKDEKWHITGHDFSHNHDPILEQSAVGVTGMRYIRTAEALSAEQCSMINAWLVGGISTKIIRLKFRKAFGNPPTDVARRVVRKLRAAQKARVDPHEMDRLLKFLAEWQAAGGVGMVKHTNWRITTVVMQHPLIRKVAQVFGRVTTLDGTHNTTRYEGATLIDAATQDSFGKTVYTGCQYSEAESEDAITSMMEALGLADIVQTVISDNSKAAAAYIAGAPRLIHHVLCFWHFRKNFSQSLETLNHEERTEIWDAVMTILKWRG
jgi:hypothetical protein